MPAPAHLRLVPTPAPAPAGALRVGRHTLDRVGRRLLLGSEPVALQARALDLLLALGGAPGELVTRQALMDTVWAGRIVEDGNLSVQINTLRRLLGGEVIVTVPGYGYKLHVQDAAAVRAEPVTAAVPALPLASAPLIGRADELQALAALVDDHVVVTVLGTAGMGKTRLARALLQWRSDRHEHGACFVDLAPVSDAAMVPAAVAAALGLRAGEAGDEQAAMIRALVRALSPLDLLLVLDNAEHLLDTVAALTSALAAGAPRVKVLVTSQAPLHTADEWLFRLGALGLPALPCTAAEALACGAVALFDQRARALDGGFAVTDDNVAQVVELCRRLDGSPLAIELAAARALRIGLPGIVAALDQRLQLLTGHARDGAPRHRTLRAALEWSHGLLDDAGQRVFRRLAVFEGGCSLALAGELLTDDPPGGAGALDANQWLDALDGLVDRGLLGLTGTPQAPRFALLESPRALALETLDAAGEAPALRQRHARALHRLLDGAHANLLDGTLGADAFAERLAPDLDNAQAALRWALAHDPALAVGLAPLISAALGRRRYGQRVALWRAVEPLLDAPPPALPAASRAWALLQCAEHWHNTRIQHAHDRAMQARAEALAQRDERLQYLTLRTLSYMAYRGDDAAGLEAAAHEARALEQPGWSPYVRSVRPAVEGWLCMHQGRHDEALHWCQRQAALSRASGASDTAVQVKVVGAQMAAGRIDECIASAQALADRLAGSALQQQRCFALSNLSAALLMQGRAAEAREVLRESWLLCENYGLQAEWTDDAALLAALEGRPRAALRLLGHADAALAAAGRQREKIDQARADQASRHATAAGGRAEWRAEGTDLADDEVHALGLGVADD